MVILDLVVDLRRRAGRSLAVVGVHLDIVVLVTHPARFGIGRTRTDGLSSMPWGLFDGEPFMVADAAPDAPSLATIAEGGVEWS